MKDPNIAYPFMFSMNTGGARPKDLPSHYDGYDCRFTQKENNFEDMKKAYRSAILKAHPDKGGDADEFRFYQEAWQSYSI